MTFAFMSVGNDASAKISSSAPGPADVLCLFMVRKRLDLTHLKHLAPRPQLLDSVAFVPEATSIQQHLAQENLSQKCRAKNLSCAENLIMYNSQSC